MLRATECTTAVCGRCFTFHSEDFFSSILFKSFAHPCVCATSFLFLILSMNYSVLMVSSFSTDSALVSLRTGFTVAISILGPLKLSASILVNLDSFTT